MKKMIIGILLILSFFWIPNVSAETLSVTLKGTYHYDTASSLLRIINEERKNRNLEEIVMDRNLTIVSNFRAKELSVFYSTDHICPDGTDALATYGYSSESTLAGKSDNPSTIFTQLMNDPEASKRLMHEGILSVGIGCFSTQNGYYYWNIIYSGGKSLNPSSYTGTVTKDAEEVLISSENVTTIRVDDLGNWNHASLGEVYALNGFSLRNNGWPAAYTYINNSNGNWVSFDSSIASIDQEGVIHTHKKGTTTISVSLGNASKSYSFTVDEADVPIESIHLSTTSITMDEATTKVLTAEVYPSNASEDKTLTYRSLNEDIVIINQNGLITAVSPGTTTIVVSSATGEVTAECSVVVNEVEEVSSDLTLNRDTASILLGESIQLENVSAGEGPEKPISWSSSDENVAIVDSNGNVTAVGEGTAIITATLEDGTKDHCVVSVGADVTNPPDVILDRDSVIIRPGEQIPLKVEVDGKTPGKGTITWSSSDESVATVDENGNVTAVGEGTATITATYSDGTKAECSITIPGESSSIVLPTDIRLDKETIRLTVGESDTLSVTLLPSNVTEIGLAYSSMDSSIATVDQTGRITAIKKGMTTIQVSTVNGLTATCSVTVLEGTASIVYHTHIQDIGDAQGFVRDGQMAGTSHQSKRLESISIYLDSLSYEDSSVKYVTHVQDIGWEDEVYGRWMENGQISGTSHQSKRLEAIKIQLTGKIAEDYDVYYRVHAQNFGWMGWAKNGEEAGTSGYGYRLEAIEIVLVKKGESPPNRTDTRTEYSFAQKRVGYSTHIQDIGWQEQKWDGNPSGTSHQSKRLESISISLYKADKLYGADSKIEYSTHIQDYGWEDSCPDRGWKSNGEISGTSHESKRLEAIKIRLSGSIARDYDVYYRVHAEEFGWMGWAKNGEEAGTAHYSYRLEAIEIVIVSKGEIPPSREDTRTEAAFLDRNDTK